MKPHAAVLTTLLTVFLAASPGLAEAQAESPNELPIVAGKSAVVSSQQPIERVSVGFGDIAEAKVLGPTEVLVNAKSPGSTSLIIWQEGGGKLFFDVNVLPNRFLADTRLDALRREIRRELPDQQITLTAEGDSVFLRGTAKDMTTVDRAVSIASTMGKVVNLLYVAVPDPEAQILLRVRFASLDRTLENQLGLNLFSTGLANTLGSVTTQQFPGPTIAQNPQQNSPATPFAFSDLLNIFLFRKDINLGATIKALENKGVLQVLAEPNVLAENGKQGSFLAGGEFPYPVAQGGGVAGNVAITVQFREFGVRLDFVPTVTPRGSIHLEVAPEVSSLDFTNGLAINGFNIPSLISRKVRSEVELEEGQSFVIGGLLDKRVTDTFEKVPFIGDIPVLGKFFQSRGRNQQNTELVVIVTPELVRPIPAGATLPGVPAPEPFLPSSPDSSVRNPASSGAGPASAPSGQPAKTIPVETLIRSQRRDPQLEVPGTKEGKPSGESPQPTSAQLPTPVSATSSKF